MMQLLLIVSLFQTVDVSASDDKDEKVEEAVSRPTTMPTIITTDGQTSEVGLIFMCPFCGT